MLQAKFQMKAVATIAEIFFGKIWKRVGRDFTPPVPAMVDGPVVGWRWLTAGRTRGGGRSRWRGVSYDDGRSGLLL
jgi:hypothetical protein